MALLDTILPSKIEAELSYLLFTPYTQGHLQPVALGHKKPKGAPYFYDVDIEVVHGQPQTISVENALVTLHPEVVDQQVWVGDFRYHIDDIFTPLGFERINTVNSKLRGQFTNGAKLVEEYLIIMIRNQNGDPTKLIRKYGKEFAQLLRFVGSPLNKTEVAETLETRISYSEKDIAVIDWNGAVIISSDDDFESETALLKVGNYQLLRYRMFDDVIDHNLSHLRKMVRDKKIGWFPQSKSILQETINQRLTMLLDFEKLNQSLLLIGDWYTTKLYSSIVSEFYLDDWKKIVSDKLEGLGEVSEVITQNLSISWERLADLLQMLGWLILLVGYFVLFYLDLIKR